MNVRIIQGHTIKGLPYTQPNQLSSHPQNQTETRKRTDHQTLP